DLDAGTALVNTASVTDAQHDTGSSSVTTLVDQDPGLTIGKIVSTTSADPNDAGQADHVGQVLTYTVTVGNTGNIDLTGGKVREVGSSKRCRAGRSCWPGPQLHGDGEQHRQHRPDLGDGERRVCHPVGLFVDLGARPQRSLVPLQDGLPI